MSMNELIIIDASIAIRHLESKLAFFIFPEPFTPNIVSDLNQELFSNWRKKVQDIDEPFPSQYLLDVLGIEGVYERSYFTRAVQEYQRQLNALFVAHGVFDDLASGAYLTMTVYKNRLRFEPHTAVSNVRICANDFRFSKTPFEQTRNDRGFSGNATSIVHPRKDLVW